MYALCWPIIYIYSFNALFIQITPWTREISPIGSHFSKPSPLYKTTNKNGKIENTLNMQEKYEKI